MGRTHVRLAPPSLPLWYVTPDPFTSFFLLNVIIYCLTSWGSFTQIVYLFALNISFTFYSTASDDLSSWLYFNILIFLGCLFSCLFLYEKTQEPIYSSISIFLPFMAHRALEHQNQWYLPK